MKAGASVLTERERVRPGVRWRKLREYDSKYQTLRAIRLLGDDELVSVKTTSGDNDLLIFTQQGMGIRFSETGLRPMGRDTQGVRGIKLRSGDQVVAACSSVDGEEVLLLTSGGYAKRTKLGEYRPQTRGGLGLKAFKLTRVRGVMVGARAVSPDDQVVLISSSGIAIRTRVDSISRQKRDSTGVRTMNVGVGELAAFTVISGGLVAE